MLPRLHARYEAVVAGEEFAAWRAKYEALKVERDTPAAMFAEVYPECERKLIDLLTRCSQLDATLFRLHHARAAGVRLHLLEPELVARGLDRFTRDQPSIARELRLPRFAADARLAWPHANQQ